MAEQYTCAACGNTYEEGWSDEEARAEYEDVFPGRDIDDADVVCDTCYQEIVRTPLAAVAIAFFGGVVPPIDRIEFGTIHKGNDIDG